MQSGGEPLPRTVRASMEPAFGQDFGHVRIHRDAAAAGTADAIGARAYTLGNHIAFNRGTFAPGTAEGVHLIAHEIAKTTEREGQRTVIRFDITELLDYHTLNPVSGFNPMNTNVLHI